MAVVVSSFVARLLPGSPSVRLDRRVVGARQQGHHSDDKIRCDTELSCRWQIIDDGYFLLTVGGKEMTWWV